MIPFVTNGVVCKEHSCDCSPATIGGDSPMAAGRFTSSISALNGALKRALSH